MKKIILTIMFGLLNNCCHAQTTIPSATPLKNVYNCNSSTVNFPYAFPISAPTDITVYQTDNNNNTTQISSNFSVNTTNLWVTYPVSGSPCPTGYQITLLPQTPQTQTTLYGSRNPFTATAVGSSLNKLTMISQQLQEQLNRSLLAPINTTTTTSLPASAPGYVIGWGANGALQNYQPNTNAYITISTDGTMGGASPTDSLIPTQKAVNTYVSGITNLPSNQNIIGPTSGTLPPDQSSNGQLLRSTSGNTATLQTTANNGYDAMRFVDDDGNEHGAIGVGNSGSGDYASQLFIESSGSSTTAFEPLIIRQTELSTFSAHQMSFNSDGSININYNDPVGHTTKTRATVNSTGDQLQGTFTAIDDSLNIVITTANDDVVSNAWADYSGTSTIVGWTSFTTKSIYTKKVGKTVFVQFDLEGTSNATTATFTVPYSTASAPQLRSTSAINQDNGSAQTGPGEIFNAGGSAVISLFKDCSGAAWTSSGTKVISGQFWYQST